LKQAVDKTGLGYLTINPQNRQTVKKFEKGAQKGRGESRLGSARTSPFAAPHSFGTNSILTGVDVMKRKDMMGHSDVTTTKIYTHLAAEDLRDSASKLNSYTNKECDYSSHTNQPQSLRARSSAG